MVVPGIARAVSHANRSALVLWSVFGPLPAMARSAARFTAAAALLVGLISAGCSEQIVVTQLPLGGSCLSCHEGITDVHPFFALACVDCHGGNDRVTIPANVNVRDQALLQKSHVLPLDPAMWWANGIDDDADGFVDEQGEFFDGRVIQSEDSPFADGRRAKRNQMDSEMNRDLNYLRFINPGDLRVAQVSCGGRNNNSNPAMVCHAEVVYDMRRSMMSTNAGVAGGAAYGNAQVPVASMFGADFAQSPAGGRYDQRNPRIGRHGYTFNYDAIDSAWNSEFVDPGRNIVAGGFDHDALLDVARTNIDPQDDKFEATAGPLFDDGVTGSDAVYDPGPGLTRTGQPLQFFDPADLANNRAVEVLQNIGNAANRSWPPQGSATELRVQRIIEALGFPRQSPVENDFDFPNPNTPGDPITNPVDAALRSFRAYHPLNWWAPNDNFGFVDFTTSPNENDEPPQDPADVELRNSNNPFGRGRPSGCTACHIEYAKDGRNLEPTDRTVADNGKQPDLELPFGIRQDLGHRFYPKRHELKRTVNTETCGSCHGFVTRVDYAMQGLYEQETDLTNLEHVNTIGTFQYTTPKGSCVRMFDNLAHYRNGQIVNDGEGRSEDLNNNGELDTNLIEADLNGDDVLQPNEDFNKNGRLDEAPISEDANGNNCLDLPDRVERRESFDGRQSRIIYGGSNGSTRLLDVHFERGFHCTDCHIQNDVHGDSNIYTRNWDAVQIECDDCHGTNDAEAPLVFSGPNGGDDMTARHYNTAFGKPWFERQNGKIIQNSRVQGGLSWVVPQLTSPKDSASAYACLLYTSRCV